MTDTRVSVLTPPGTGAIATVAVAGPRAWELTRQLVRPAGKTPLPESPDPLRFWFGTLGDGAGDEVVLAVRQLSPESAVEIHCHGGRRVVRWVVEQFTTRGCIEISADAGLHPALNALPQARTLRTASILLDQYHGVFDRAVRDVLAHLDAGRTDDAGRDLAALAGFADVGRHLVEPWTVVVAGPPNVGKSSLVNALAGYQRTVVSPTAGTTRDVVTVPVAFDGWPVELADTAGVREAVGIEGEGVARARQSVGTADLVVWVFDATAAEPEFPPAGVRRLLPVINKVDRAASWDVGRVPDALRVSAATGDGVAGLAAAVARLLVPVAPPGGAAVPYSRELADRTERAYRSFAGGNIRATRQNLLACAIIPGHSTIADD